MGAEESNATRGFTDLPTNLRYFTGRPHPIGSTGKCGSQSKSFLGGQFERHKKTVSLFPCQTSSLAMLTHVGFDGNKGVSANLGQSWTFLLYLPAPSATPFRGQETNAVHLDIRT